jgi:hypothetical protein
MEIVRTIPVASQGTGYPDGEGPNLVVYQGLTTANGAVGGNTIVDDGLALLPNLTGLPVWLISGAFKGQSRLITSHIGNTLTVDTPYSGQVVAVTAYMVLPFYMPLAGLVLDIDVPAIDVPNNVLERDVIGNKGDTAVIVLGVVASLMGYVKGVLAQVNWVVAAVTTVVNWIAAWTRLQGVSQPRNVVYDLNAVGGAGTFDLVVGTAQDVQIDAVVVRNPVNVTAGATTSFSIQTNDATPQIFVLNTIAVKAALTAGAQFAWSGAGCILKVGQKIQITVNGAASGIADVLDIDISYHAVVSGGYVA